MGRKKMGTERRGQIVSALYDCLAETGYDNISVKKLAERAGLSHGAIHYYFKDKDEIVGALVLSIVETYEAQLDKLMSEIPSGRPAIKMLMDHFLDDFIFDARLNKVFINLMQMSFDRARIREYMRRYLDLYRGNVLKVLEYSDIPEAEARLLAHALTALIDGLGMHWIIDQGSMDRKAIDEMLNYLGEKIGFLPAGEAGT